MIPTGYPDKTRADLLARLHETAARIAKICDDYVPFLEAGSTASANVIQQLFSEAESFEAELVAVRGADGMAGYLRQVEGDPAYDLAAEVGAVIAAMDACRAAGRAIIVDPDGYTRTQQVGADGRVTVRQVTPAEYAGLIQPLRDLRALIEVR